MITRRRARQWGMGLGAACALAVIAYAAAWIAGGAALARLDALRCDGLRVVDRHGLVLREVPGCSGWTHLGEVPELWRRLVVAGEDRRFQLHAGVDLPAVARAFAQNLRAGRIVSGASTLSMQLARGLFPECRGRTLRAKLLQAFWAIALERRLTKPEILEAYLNVAYYGGGAVGPAAAARRWFDKPVSALSDGESALLAVLPRAPRSYDPRWGLARAIERRARVLAQVELSAEQKAAIQAEPLAISARAPARTAHAGHFVDQVLASLPEPERRAGGVLRTTLDLPLQQRLEAALHEHVAGLADSGVEQAGLVVLDAQSGEVRALVGSRDYASSQLNIVTRRRQLGSLLKPFVYALALEGGARADSLALDVGDVPSAYQARDWVGREGGPLAYREALAGSYNLAAVHVLEHVGVAALHARLRLAGVARLPSPPASYGLPLALGSARVRLLDVVAGYGFLVREGSVREPSGLIALERSDGSRWLPARRSERRVFSPEVSWQVLHMLSDEAARHRRFGRGLPVAGDVALKTGTASGLTDLSAVLATREFLVGAWVGRFDAAATSGASGMWAAAPLAARALEIALGGRAPSLPARPATLPIELDAEVVPDAPPPALAAWAQRARARVQGAR